MMYDKEFLMEAKFKHYNEQVQDTVNCDNFDEAICCHCQYNLCCLSPNKVDFANWDEAQASPGTHRLFCFLV